ncbi:MAG TPA: hypothetical protein VLE43_11615 [Candidatus Saccharimonadia bacterium]|nr:hypothetical protein [Candidatus Saccharimonadia bacterium]
MHEKSAASNVLEICRSRGRQFSLRDIVSRIHEMHPELAEDFPDVWGDLVRRKKVRICHAGDILLYEVVMTNR